MIDVTEVWKDVHSSIVKIKHLKVGKSISSGTGFICRKHLITNNHVYANIGADKIKLETVLQDGYTTNLKIELTYDDFRKRLIEGMPEQSWDFAIISISDTPFFQLLFSCNG
ncbi:hypothetical protein [Flagellimonas lutimaris]|uniref:hypothetical protein n=1 Tax=Flagellimonas lutimaris TaxID=475082 RepID=UPI0011C4487A|nr:hypothetical protein [Allomuricauda lutimaris]